MASNANKIIKGLDNLYPDAHCELNHSSHFELLIAVMLSAQTTDERVNMVTPNLFNKYHGAKELAKANVNEVEEIIKSIGLAKSKARNIIKTSQILSDMCDGEVPNNREFLESLPGVGRKTCNVVLSNCFDEPAFAVDTHVSRVSKRLRIADKEDDVRQIEEKLMTYFPKKKWGKLHHQFIFFGRYKCKAKAPECLDCPFTKICDKAS
ncbi:MAG: endonuclease III [Erysipelotrichaceae bacterium]|nr:endonuclease III [Erysipelotrichaceae bacterium]